MIPIWLLEHDQVRVSHLILKNYMWVHRTLLHATDFKVWHWVITGDFVVTNDRIKLISRCTNTINTIKLISRCTNTM